MRKAEYRVISEFDPKKKYKTTIIKRCVPILELLKQDEVFEPKTLIQDIIKDPPKNIVVRQENIQRLVTRTINLAVKIGVLDRLTDEIDAKFKEFSNLESVQFWMNMLSSPRQKHKDAIMIKNESANQYGYRRRVFWFNKWVIGKKIRVTIWKAQKIDKSGSALCKKTTDEVTIQGLEHLLYLYRESESKDVVEFQKLFTQYFNDPIHEGKMAGAVKNDVSAIQSYFTKNYADIKIGYDVNKKYKQNVGGDEHKTQITISDLKKLLTFGRPSTMEKAIVICKFHRGLDNSTFADSFNFDVWSVLADYFGTENFRNWDLAKCPVPVPLVRMKTQYYHMGCLDRDAIWCLQKWLDEREKMTGKQIQKGEPMFVTNKLMPVMDSYVAQVVPKLAKNAKINRKLSGYIRSTRYEKNTHELRDLLDSILEKNKVEEYVIDESIGHKNKNNYRKASKLFLNDFRREYMKASKDLNVLTGITNYMDGDSEKDLLEDKMTIMQREHKDDMMKVITKIAQLEREKMEAKRSFVDDMDEEKLEHVARILAERFGFKMETKRELPPQNR